MRDNCVFEPRTISYIPFRADGTVQVVASKFLEGKPIGPFDFQGTRKDDANDIFAHQDRRELRGLRLFCAWLNHNDSDSVNTLDMWVQQEEGAGYVQHDLIDFGTVMGSGATHPHARRVGNEYYIECGPALKSAATFGIWARPWRNVEYIEYPSVGRFESSYFKAELWRPDYPNPAFDRMSHQDALWAARTVMRFSDEAVRAIVATGDYEDQDAERYVADALIERRDKIVRYWLAQIDPIDGFEVAGTGGSRRLEFVNLGVEAGLATSCRYGYAWHSFGNETGVHQALGAPGVSASPSIPVPGDSAPFLMVKLASSCIDQPKWTSEVRVFLRNSGTPTVVGVERDDPAQ